MSLSTGGCRLGVALLAALLLAVAQGTPAQALPDGRGWELVSPVQKNGGRISEPEDGGVLQSSPVANAVAYASPASFGAAQGAPPLSQYLATRGASGWSTQNLSPAGLAGAYAGSPFAAFSDDLSRRLLLDPSRCPEGDPCPEGYELKEGGTSIPSPSGAGTFAAADPELEHLAFLDGTDLGLWSPPSSSLVPIATDVAAGLFVSEGATRTYWQGEDANLYLREGATTKQLDDTAGGGGSFEGATPDGSVAFFAKGGHLYRYLAAVDIATDITPGGRVITTLGSSPDGEVAFYLDASGLWRWRLGSGAAQLLSGSLPGADPLTSASAANGSRLFFTTTRSLVASDTNADRDAYQWEQDGTGSCAKAQGCTELISSGRSEGGAVFAGASEDGSSAFFITDGSLVPADPGAFDLYVARVGGGFPEALDPIPCTGDSCQSLPSEPRDPGLATLFTGPGNPKVHFARERCRRGKVRRHGRCVAKRRAKQPGVHGRAGKKRGGRR